MDTPTGSGIDAFALAATVPMALTAWARAEPSVGAPVTDIADAKHKQYTLLIAYLVDG
jgi:hypothetical protein